jgi:hypothetical protein
MPENPPGLDTLIPELTHALNAHANALVASSNKPNVSVVPATTLTTATPTGDITLVWPVVPGGRRWKVFRIVIGGNTWASTVDGSAVIYSDTMELAGTPPSTRTVIDYYPTLPEVGLYVDGQIVLSQGAYLQAYVKAPSFATTYVAVALVLSEPLG